MDTNTETNLTWQLLSRDGAFLTSGKATTREEALEQAKTWMASNNRKIGNLNTRNKNGIVIDRVKITTRRA